MDSTRDALSPSDKTEELLVQALQLLEGLEAGATSHVDAAVFCTIDGLLLQLERSSEEPAQQAILMNAPTAG